MIGEGNGNPLPILPGSLVVSDSVQPRRQQPTRLPHPWDSPGKNTGVGCHPDLGRGSLFLVATPVLGRGVAPLGRALCAVAATFALRAMG